MTSIKKNFLLIVFFSSGVACGFFLSENLYGDTDAQNDCLKRYPLVNPLIDCAQEQDEQSELKALHQELQESIDKAIKEKKVDRISVWIRKLRSQKWVGVNQHERYFAASLLKTPLFVTFLKLEEFRPEIAEIKIVYKIPDNYKSAIKQVTTYEGTELRIGQEYTVRALLEQMILHSDNISASLLFNMIDKNLMSSVSKDLGIEIQADLEDRQVITAKSYANIFRILYNSSFLNHNNSEYALTVLNKSDFNEGLRKYIPAGINLPHKFGEREFTNSYGQRKIEIHDCGIVYLPNDPYSICIMTEGNNRDLLLEEIASVSKRIYDEIR